MFKFMKYTQQEINYFNLPSGYIYASGNIRAVNDYFENLMEELNHFKEDEFIHIVWDDKNFVELNKEIWNEYTKSVVPHEINKSLNLPSDRTLFDDMTERCKLDYPSEGQVNLPELCMFLADQYIESLMRLIIQKRLMFSNEILTHEVDDAACNQISLRVKSANNI